MVLILIHSKNYLSQENPSSSNILKAQPILFNNENQIGEIKIWIQYDNENILLKEADILYDSIEKNKAHCYFFNLNQADI